MELVRRSVQRRRHRRAKNVRASKSRGSSLEMKKEIDVRNVQVLINVFNLRIAVCTLVLMLNADASCAGIPMLRPHESQFNDCGKTKTPERRILGIVSTTLLA